MERLKAKVEPLSILVRVETSDAFAATEAFLAALHLVELLAPGLVFLRSAPVNTAEHQDLNHFFSLPPSLHVFGFGLRFGFSGAILRDSSLVLGCRVSCSRPGSSSQFACKQRGNVIPRHFSK